MRQSTSWPWPWQLAALLTLAAAAQGPAAEATGPAYTPLVRAHYDRLLDVGLDRYGRDHSGLWLASIDIVRGGQPDRADPAVKRTYRDIHAPRGSNLYWDQPALVAAHQLGRLTGEPRYAAAADRYVADFLQRCVSPHNGLFLWGNHLYYQVFDDTVVGFSGGHHEARPLPCAWELFWRISPQKTERCIRAMAVQHVKDPQTGIFDRHADVKATRPPSQVGGAHPFLESGGVLVQSLGWLAAKTGRHDPWLAHRARLVARFSFDHRGPATGLLQNQPGPEKRWDYEACTTEVGLWAGCLLRAADDLHDDDLRAMARHGVAAYLRYGFDPATGRYFGQLNVSDGTPRRPQRTAGSGEATVYQPGQYADLWEPLFPTHNYPMSMAEACLTLWQQTGDEAFRQAVRRWAAMIAAAIPANGGKGAYADQYGRCLHFLCRSAEVLGDRSLLELARRLADEAVGHLYSPRDRMFRSHPGEDRCDAVDGIGILFLGLLYLETGRPPDLMGLGL